LIRLNTNEMKTKLLGSNRRNNLQAGQIAATVGTPLDAQNLFIRNILSSLGVESLNEEDWNFTKAYFSHKCAYCGAETELLMEHAIPINKAKLGEHRLGNLVRVASTAIATRVAKTLDNSW